MARPQGKKRASMGSRRASTGSAQGRKFGDKKKSYGDDDKRSSTGSEREGKYGDKKKRFDGRASTDSAQGRKFGDKKKSYRDDDKRSSTGSEREGKYGDKKKRFDERSSMGSRRVSTGSAQGRKFGDKKKSYGDDDKRSSTGSERGGGKYGNKKKNFGHVDHEEGAKNKFVRKKAGFDKKKTYLDKEFKDDDTFDFKEYKEDKKRSAKAEEVYKNKIKKSSKNKSEKHSHQEGIRLNKFIANTGICSRREADTMIKTGVITVNGKVVTELGTRVSLDDKIMFHDQTLNSEKLVYVLLNKPKDYITTSDDPDKRKTVMDLVGRATKERIYPVGRLDRNTTGLLLFTNDGELTKKLTHPKYETKKIYHVMTDKNVKKEHLDAMISGLELEDGFIQVDDVQFVGDSKNKKDIGIEIHSGRNRIVRRLFEHFDYKVVKLDRVMFAGLTKKDLPRGKWRLLTAKEVQFLKQS